VRHLLALLALSAAPIVAPAAAAAAVPVVADACAEAATQVIPTLPAAQQRLAPQRVWQLSRGGPGPVAVLDTGVSAVAPALAGAVLPGVDVSTGGPADDDCAGHGTFIAGLIAARPLAGTSLVGIAPQVSILPIRVTADPSQVDPADLAAGIRAAVDAGARVLAVPVATPAVTPQLRDAVTYAAGRDALVVAAADLGPENQISYPAALPGVLSVASGGRPGRTPAQLTAPGGRLVGIAPTGAGQVVRDGPAGVAFVAAAAALVRDYHPDLSAAQVAHRLVATADRPSAAVNPVAAVATLLPEEHGRSAPTLAPDPVSLAPVPAPDTGPARIALRVALALTAVLLLAAVVATVVRQWRRRWAGTSARKPRSAG